MKFLITGATGQLGREWIHFLQEKKLDFEAFSSNQLDITDSRTVNQKIDEVQPDVVINCAAYTNVDGAETESEKAFLVNETGLKHLVTACEETGAKLVHFSTDYVFSGSEDDQKKYPKGYPETAKTNPINIYGKSKKAGEEVLQNANCDWMLIRVSWLCGRFGNNFAKTMLRLGKERDDLSVVDDQIGCPSFAFDVVEKTVRLLEDEENGIFHISSEGMISWADFAEEIFKVAGLEVNLKRITSEEYPFTASRPMFTLLSKNKIRKLGFQLLEWNAGVRQLLQQIDSEKK